MNHVEKMVVDMCNDASDRLIGCLDKKIEALKAELARLREELSTAQQQLAEAMDYAKTNDEESQLYYECVDFIFREPVEVWKQENDDEDYQVLKHTEFWGGCFNYQAEYEDYHYSVSGMTYVEVLSKLCVAMVRKGYLTDEKYPRLVQALAAIEAAKGNDKESGE